MNNENEIIKRVDNPMDGPKDGVQATVECIRTDFLGKGKRKKGGVPFKQRPKSKAQISASHELGVLSIHDMSSDVMLTVSIEDAVSLITAAIITSKEERKNEELPDGSPEE